MVPIAGSGSLGSLVLAGLLGSGCVCVSGQARLLLPLCDLGGSGRDGKQGRYGVVLGAKLSFVREICLYCKLILCQVLFLELGCRGGHKQMYPWTPGAFDLEGETVSNQIIMGINA
jgi:hypothetical protein